MTSAVSQAKISYASEVGVRSASQRPLERTDFIFFVRLCGRACGMDFENIDVRSIARVFFGPMGPPPRDAFLASTGQRWEQDLIDFWRGA